MKNHNKHTDHDPLLLDHEADGIRELDNKLPRWWVWLFYLTTIFAVLYLGYYHVFGYGKSSGAEFLTEWRAGELIKSNSMAKFEVTVEALQPSKDEAVLARGKTTFTMLCAPCHRPAFLARQHIRAELPVAGGRIVSRYADVPV